MAKVTGTITTITGMNMSMPNGCCRCGRPSTHRLKTQTVVKGFNLGGTKTRSIEIPYCAACADRAKKVNRARTMLWLSVSAVAVVVAGFGVLVPFLPKAAIIVVPCLLAVMAAVVLRQRAGETVENPWGAWLSAASKNTSTLFCSNPEWGKAFADANGIPAVAGSHSDTVRPWIGALLIAGSLATFVSFATQPAVRVDNGGKVPLQIWIDGKKSIVVDATYDKGDRKDVTVPFGTHVFGWSPVGADKPTELTHPRKIEWMGDHLYNPGSTACYWLDVSTYGTASAKGMAAGPQPLDDLYTFKKLDNWFKDNPSSVSTKASGETRVAVNTMKVCHELSDHGCALPIRKDMLDCMHKAFAKDDKAAFEACVDAAVASCKK